MNLKVLKNIIFFEIKDILKSKWFFIYSLLIFSFTYLIIFYSGGSSAEIIATISNFYLMALPLFILLFGIVNFQETLSFQKLLLVKGLSRLVLFSGKFSGMLISLILCYLIGLIPFIIFYPKIQDIGFIFILLVIYGFFIHIIFLSLSMLINQLQLRLELSSGLAIFIWFLLYIIYDAFIFSILVHFQNYPIETLVLFLLFLNPIDLIRTSLFILSKLDQIMNYSSALFVHTFGSHMGITIGILVLIFQSSILFFISYKKFKNKDL